jgi:hypothetical protein
MNCFPRGRLMAREHQRTALGELTLREEGGRLAGTIGPNNRYRVEFVSASEAQLDMYKGGLYKCTSVHADYHSYIRLSSSTVGRFLSR